MVKKFTEIVETKLSSQERKNLIKIIVVLTIVFSMGLAFGEIFLKGHSKDENIPTIFACEEFSGIPFEINGVETKNAQAILENINSEAYVQINLEGDAQYLTLKLPNDICNLDYRMNEEENKIEPFLSVQVKVFFEDGSSKMHDTYKILEDNDILLFDFPEGTKNIIIVSSDTITAHEFFSESEYEEAKQYKLIKDIYLNFD